MFMCIFLHDILTYIKCESSIPSRIFDSFYGDFCLLNVCDIFDTLFINIVIGKHFFILPIDLLFIVFLNSYEIFIVTSCRYRKKESTTEIVVNWVLDISTFINRQSYLNTRGLCLSKIETTRFIISCVRSALAKH